MTVKLQTERHLEFLSLTEGCTDSSESTLVEMTHCWKSHAAAQMSSIVVMHNLVLFVAVTIVGNEQNAMAVQNVTSFIFCTIHAVHARI